MNLSHNLAATPMHPTMLLPMPGMAPRVTALQAGRTLIELLVAIALGLLILLGVGTLYVGANQSVRATSNISGIEESAATIISLLGNSIRRAGYSEIVGAGQSRQTSFLYNGAHLMGCTNQHFTVTAGDPASFACSGTAAVRAGNDVLAVWYQAENRLTVGQGNTFDCLGSTPPGWTVTEPSFAGVLPATGGLSVGQIRLVRNVYYLDAAGNLMCLGSGNDTPQPLMGGVEQFRVFYGFDAAAFAAPPASVLDEPIAGSLRDAAALNGEAALSPTIDAWDYVVSVHVCVVLRSQEGGVRSAAGNAFRPCPANATEAGGAVSTVAGPDDGAVRRSFNQVFTLRSRATPAPLGL